MSIEIDETLPPKERKKQFQQILEDAQEWWAGEVYAWAIKSGASPEEATKQASESKCPLVL